MKKKIGIVAEGVTDFMLLRSLLNHFLDCHCQLIQPEIAETQGLGGHQGAYGGGWKGIRTWCQNLTNDFGNLTAFFNKLNIDLLIIHIDADVAREDEINCAKPCPPVQDTCEALAKRVMTWLGEPVIDKKLVLCIPADNTEAWILAAHDIQTTYHALPDKPLECVYKPDMIISNQRYKKPRRLLRTKNGKPKKTRRDYQQLIPVVLDNWDDVKRICKMAAKFEKDLQASIE
ncbi:hypothetical protein [Candidatus Parabeggiatoa sp. HSG14]|uniref:hypothetical protein n=1 Tax=Candidatus Parabeggiatoa sp. HSG14 TaxID=3055593 RepID=UPI0025A799CC|nr:hypothetical protein [Thiotrichales bacterium HSG14]